MKGALATHHPISQQLSCSQPIHAAERVDKSSEVSCIRQWPQPPRLRYAIHKCLLTAQYLYNVL